MKGVARLGVNMIHDGKRERGLPWQRRFGFARILTVPGFALWRSARVMPASCGGFWLWRSFMTAAHGAMRPGSGASAYRRSAARSAVLRTVLRFNARGPDGLIDAKHPGRSRN